MSQGRVLKFGVIGIGNAGGGVLRLMKSMPQVEVVAVADLRPHAREAFQKEFGGRAYDNVEALCEDPNVDAVWVATPNPYHAPHTIIAAEHGKHVVCEKPMTISLADAEAMINAADKHGVKLLSGHTRAFDPPIQAMWRIVRSGEVGPIRALNVFSFTQWMLSARMPEEVDETKGGGVAFRQAPHQIDTLRFLGGGLVRSVRGMTQAWMAGRLGAPGYYAGYLEFEDGTPATITYNAYGYFQTAEFLPWVAEAPDVKGAEERAEIRRALRDGTWDDERIKDELRYGGARQSERLNRGGGATTRGARFLGDMGILLVSCEKGMLRQSPRGIYVYNDENGVREEVIEDDMLPANDPTLQEAYDGIVLGKPIFHDGRWGMATLEVQLALMQSARERREITLKHQVAVPKDLTH